MSSAFEVDWIVLALVLLAAVIAMIGVLKNAPVSRSGLIALQLLCAPLLLTALLLRDTPLTGSMLVLTAGATRADIAKLAAAEPSSNDDIALLPPLIALGGVDLDLDEVERAPDLATALRRYPGISHVHVLGHGLDAHDRDALGARELSFDPASDLYAKDSDATDATDANATAAVVEWELPTAVNAGAVWRLRGRVRGKLSTIELRDPADALEATTTPAADGSFELLGIARAMGPVQFSLRLRDGETTLQTLPVPIHATTAPPVRALLLAAVPSPELKYLRRWASDAGIELDSRITLAPGLTQARNVAAIDAAMLAKLDLLIVDERSWPQLARQATALREAISKGLGILIRITGPVPAAVQADWRGLGLEFELATNTPRAINLDDGAAVVAGERLHAWPLTFSRGDYSGGEHVEILGDSKARAVAIRRPLGQGRIGLLALTDSFRLATRGEHARHASLWSNLVTELARARAEATMQLPELAVIGQRAVVCGASDGVLLQLPDASRQTLLRDSAAAGCAAFWPTTAGWHRLIAVAESQPSASAATKPSSPSADLAFYVFDPSQIASVLTQRKQFATAALVNRNAPPSTSPSDLEHWRRAALLAWLLAMVASWWLERRLRQAPGRAASPDEPANA